MNNHAGSTLTRSFIYKRSIKLPRGKGCLRCPRPSSWGLTGVSKKINSSGLLSCSSVCNRIFNGIYICKLQLQRFSLLVILMIQLFHDFCRVEWHYTSIVHLQSGQSNTVVRKRVEVIFYWTNILLPGKNLYFIGNGFSVVSYSKVFNLLCEGTKCFILWGTQQNQLTYFH